MKERVSRYLLIFLFLFIQFLVMININTEKGKISITENRYLAQFPVLFNNAGEISQGLNRQFEAWLNDNIGFRDEFLKLHSMISLHVLHVSPTENVHIGKDGWYFYTQDNNLEIARNEYPLTEELLQEIAKDQQAIQEYYAERGIDYVLVLNPSKVSIYPEYIREVTSQVQETPMDILARYLKENTTVNVISTKDALLTEKENQIVYFKTDTHWNLMGAYTGYKSILHQLGELGLIKNAVPASVREYPTTFRGEFSAMMGDETALPLEEVKGIEIVDQKGYQVYDGELFNQVNRVKQKFNILENSLIYTNPDAEKETILIYGDSMFEYWNIVPLFAENSSDLVYLRSYFMYDELTEAVKPDLVIYEWAERLITRMPGSYSPWYLRPPLKNPQAEIINVSLPSEIRSGESYNIDIAVKNTGTESWSEDLRIRLCIYQDGGGDVGHRVKLPEGVVVNPGETYVFTLENFIAPFAARTILEFQMAEEGFAYFGEIKRVEINIK